MTRRGQATAYEILSTMSEVAGEASEAHISLRPRGLALAAHVGHVLWGAWSGPAAGGVLATGGADGLVRLWNPGTTEPAAGSPEGNYGASTWGVWHDVGATAVLAFGGRDGRVTLWDAESRTAGQ